jgi:phenylalanyl-tRNA synthetase alpha chain
MRETIRTIREGAGARLTAANDRQALDAWRVEYLGTSGQLRRLMDGLKSLPREEKPAAGKELNELKGFLEELFSTAEARIISAATSSSVDLTEPGTPLRQGRRHILTRTIDEVIDVFARMGFELEDGPEVEDEWHNFDALNIPASHPARDPGDNFFLASSDGIRRLLRTQTSTVQIRAMESRTPPLKVVAVGRVYRPDTHDATHYSMFHQIEGLCIDRDLSLTDLKSALIGFARAYFGVDAEVRMRPSYFPFTEPSAEVDMKMLIRGEPQWVELGGCGMVDPNVLKAVGIDAEVWSGYAFGLGIERIAMRRYGIPDIRWLFENDARFLRQF